MYSARVNFEQCLIETLAMLRRQQRVSYRALKRQFGVDDAFVEDLKAEIVEVLELAVDQDRKSTRLNSSHIQKSRMPSSA